MTAPDRGGSRFPLRLLLFRAGDRAFGAPAAQVAVASRPGHTPEREAGLEPGLETDAPLWFYRLAGCPAGPAPASPVAIRLRRSDGPGRLLLLDAMEDLVEVAADAIRPLPPLVAQRLFGKGMWAVLPRAGRLYVLVDLERLAG